MAGKENVILNVDTGLDDAVAILLAAGSKKINLQGITVVAGNHTLPNVLQNTLNVCAYAGIQAPIFAGMEKPLLRKQVTAERIHGQTGLGDVKFPEYDLKPEEEHATDFIIKQSLNSSGDLILISVSPLTNIAMSLLREPRIKEGIQEIILMGGACKTGNATASAEFNIYADPEAAKIVFESGLPITMVGLDLTRQAKCYPKIVEQIKKLDNRVSDLITKLLEFLRSTYKEVFGLETPPLHDPCAVAKVVDRSVFETREARVDIETNKGLNYGRTVCDFFDRSNRGKNAEVATKLDREKFWNILIDILSKY